METSLENKHLGYGNFFVIFASSSYPLLESLRNDYSDGTDNATIQGFDWLNEEK